MLTPFGPEIWIADGASVSTGGFHYGTRMAVIRLPDGGLFVWSPIKLTQELRSAERADELDQVVMRGCLITSEVVFFHRKSATALFTDLIQQFPPGWFGGWREMVARLDLMMEAELPRKFRNTFVSGSW